MVLPMFLAAIDLCSAVVCLSLLWLLDFTNLIGKKTDFTNLCGLGSAVSNSMLFPHSMAVFTPMLSSLSISEFLIGLSIYTETRDSVLA